MTALALILALVGAAVLLPWLAGRVVRLPAPSCSHTSQQGRSCTCMTTTETPP